jgi:hypothetical protein
MARLVMRSPEFSLENTCKENALVKKKTILTTLAVAALATSALAQSRQSLHTIHKAYVEPVDELGDDKAVASCLADHLKALTPIEAVASKDDADAIFKVAAHLPSTTTKVMLGVLGGSPSGHLTVELPDGTKLWDDGSKFRRSMMKQGQLGSASSDTGKSIECGLADELADTLRSAMKKSRDSAK